MKIRSFRHKGLKAFALTGNVSGILPTHANRLRFCLRILRSSVTPYGLLELYSHPMTSGSKLEGYRAMKIAAQWRLVFRVNRRREICDIDYLNYH